MLCEVKAAFFYWPCWVHRRTALTSLNTSWWVYGLSHSFHVILNKTWYPFCKLCFFYGAQPQMFSLDNNWLKSPNEHVTSQAHRVLTRHSWFQNTRMCKCGWCWLFRPQGCCNKQKQLVVSYFLITKVFLLLGGTLRWNPLNMAAVSHRSLGGFFSLTVVILKKQILNYKFVVFCLQHFLTCLYFRLYNGLIPQKFLKIKK